MYFPVGKRKYVPPTIMGSKRRCKGRGTSRGVLCSGRGGWMVAGLCWRVGDA